MNELFFENSDILKTEKTNGDYKVNWITYKGTCDGDARLFQGDFRTRGLYYK